MSFEDSCHSDDFIVAHAHAAGFDVHKVQIRATIRSQPSTGQAIVLTQEFSASLKGLDELYARLRDHGTEAVLLEGTGVYWQVPVEATVSVLPSRVWVTLSGPLSGRPAVAVAWNGTRAGHAYISDLAGGWHRLALDVRHFVRQYPLAGLLQRNLFDPA